VTAPKLAITDSDPSSTTADAVVVGTVQGPDGLALAAGSEAVNAAFDGALLDVLDAVGASGRAD
jgi:leucyl aminopeptidase